MTGICSDNGVVCTLSEKELAESEEMFNKYLRARMMKKIKKEMI